MFPLRNNPLFFSKIPKAGISNDNHGWSPDSRVMEHTFQCAYTVMMKQLERFNLLDETAAAAVREDVMALRSSWTRRHPSLPSFTLGAASYLDARQAGAAAYLSLAKQLNPQLSKRFSSLHDEVLGSLSAFVGDTVKVTSELALPGFHIFLADRAFEQPVADVHFDLQYQWIDWQQYGGIDPQSQISFTLPVRIPKGGAGLTIWKSDWMSVAHLEPSERAARIRETTEQVEERYEQGVLVIHTGHWLHRISPARDVHPDDERITLQGHAIRTGSGWIAYW